MCGGNVMQLTGTYGNYLTMSNLLSPLGVKGSGELVLKVFNLAMNTFEQKVDQRIFSKESSNALAQLYMDATAVSEEAKKLTLTGLNSVFNDRTPVSSDTSVLTATAIDSVSQDTGATETEYDIRVLQLARSQHNTGYELNATDTGVVQKDVNTFEITINGERHAISVEVQSNDTNEDVLQKIAAAINDAAAGVIAYVINGSTEGSRQMSVIGEETGSSSNFTLEDTGGNAISTTGAATVSIAAQDARYSVDGDEYTSERNTVSLDNDMVTVTLKQVGSAPLIVSPDKKNIAEAVTDLVSQVNFLLSFLGKNKEYLKESLFLSLNDILNKKTDELESIGITKGKNGGLRIDPEGLENAVNEDISLIKETFGGRDGLAVRIDNLMSHVTTGFPLQYAKEADTIPRDSFYDIYKTSKEMLETMLSQNYLIGAYI